jgi:hypothetical protein
LALSRALGFCPGPLIHLIDSSKCYNLYLVVRGALAGYVTRVDTQAEGLTLNRGTKQALQSHVVVEDQIIIVELFGKVTFRLEV